MSLDEMIEYLKVYGYIKSKEVEEAFRKVDRIHFVPERYKGEAYEDLALPLLKHATISAPGVVARMMELLEVKKGMKVLDIGVGSGYTTCILSHLVGKEGKVIGVEIDKDVLEYAKDRVRRFSLGNVLLICGDGKFGYKDEAPYDRILVNAASKKIWESWTEQLKENGKGVVPLGEYYQKLVVFRKEGIIKEDISVVFVPLF